VVLAEGEDVEPHLLDLRAIRRTALIRSASLGARPVVGSVVISTDREDPELHDDLQ
jgi:hypothetical protein